MKSDKKIVQDVIFICISSYSAKCFQVPNFTCCTNGWWMLGFTNFYGKYAGFEGLYLFLWMHKSVYVFIERQSRPCLSSISIHVLKYGMHYTTTLQVRGPSAPGLKPTCHWCKDGKKKYMYSESGLRLLLLYEKAKQQSLFCPANNRGRKKLQSQSVIGKQ